MSELYSVTTFNLITCNSQLSFKLTKRYVQDPLSKLLRFNQLINLYKCSRDIQGSKLRVEN